MGATGEIVLPVESDADLALRCVRGERAAQRQLFEDHKAGVHATLYRIVGSNRGIENLVQETFLEVFQSLQSYTGEALNSWTVRICTQVALSHEKSAPVDPEGAEGKGPDRLYAALDTFDTRQRIAFALQIIDGRSLREVADLTESGLVTTRSRVWRARRELEKLARRDSLLRGYLREQASPFQAPPAIEALSELSWKRIERRVFSGIDEELAEPRRQQTPAKAERRPRAGFWLAAGGALAAAAALVVVTRPAPIQTPSEAAQRSRIVTQSSSTEILAGDAEIELAPRSIIWLDRAGEELALTLDEGGVRLKVAPRENRAPVSVHAGKVRIEVVGTEFRVHRRDSLTEVEVFEGVVSVVAEGKRSRVSAGESWSTTAGLHRVPENSKAQDDQELHPPGHP